MNRSVVVCVGVLSMWLVAGTAAAQTDDSSIQIGGQLTGAVSGEFEGTDLGVGGLLAWRPSPLLGLEAEVDFYPGEFGTTARSAAVVSRASSAPRLARASAVSAPS